MAEYGTATYGVDEWGGAYELGAARLLYMLRMAPRWSALANLIDQRYQRLIGIAEQLRTSLALDTASGALLDIIGQWLGLERQGMTDDRYRRALRVQVVLLSSATGSSQSLLDVWQRWITTDADTYRNVAPAYAEISGVISEPDEYLLRIFLRRAAPAGVVLSALVTYADNAFILDDVEGTLPNAGILDNTESALAEASILPHEVM